MTAPVPPQKPTPPTAPILVPIVRGECDKGRPRCRKPARLFPVGWCCVEHEPKPSTAPTRPTTAA